MDSQGGYELRYSRIVRGVGAALCAISVLVAIFAFSTTPEPGTLTIGPWHMRYVNGGPSLAWGAVPCVLGGFVLIVESFTVFRIDPDGVVRQRIFGKPAYLRWSDVSTVRAENHERAIRIVTPGLKMSFSAWLSGRDVLAARLLAGVPPSAIADRAESELEKLATGVTE
jgi:hypothetical protein